MNRQIPVCGMKFPPQINPATGRFVMSDGAAGVKESVYLILMTQKSERFTHPQFGSTVLSYPFTDPSPTRIHMMEREIKETILSQEPRIEDAKVSIDYSKKSQTMLVMIDYVMKEGEMGYVEIPI